MTEKLVRSIRWPHTALVVCCLAMICITSVRPTRAADPFYLGQLRDGTLAHSRGDNESAVRLLQIACFGLLDEPALLAEGLVRLSLAQAASGNQEGFEETFQRLVLIEERFEAFSIAEIPPDVRASFEATSRSRLPGEVLRSSDPLWTAMTRMAPPPMSAVPGPAVGSAIEPDPEARQSAPDIDGLLGTARAELADDRPKKAKKHLDQVLQMDPGRTEAICLRGQALALLGQCQEALAGIEACRPDPLDPSVSIAQLDCLVQLKKWQEAVDFYQSLPEAAHSNSRVIRLGEKAARKQKQTSVAEPATTVSAAPGNGTGETSPSEAAAPPSIPTPAQEAKDPVALAAIRADFDAAGSAADLLPTVERAKRLADTYPSWREAQLLAAELAYQTSSWTEAVAYFQRAGEPDEQEPALLFYYSVALFESGDRQAAAEALERALPLIESGDFVLSYRDKILGGNGN